MYVANILKNHAKWINLKIKIQQNSFDLRNNGFIVICINKRY